MSYISQDDAPIDNCAICTEPLKDPTKALFRLTCGHVFHNNCLNDLCEHDFPNINCPQCRTPMDENECNTFWAFKEGPPEEGPPALDPDYLNSLPQDVQNVYNNTTINQGGKHSKNRTKKSRRNKKSRHNKKSTRRRRSSIKRKY